MLVSPFPLVTLFRLMPDILCTIWYTAGNAAWLMACSCSSFLTCSLAVWCHPEAGFEYRSSAEVESGSGIMRKKALQAYCEEMSRVTGGYRLPWTLQSIRRRALFSR